MKFSVRLLLLPAIISFLMACGKESNTLPNAVVNKEADTAINKEAEATTTCIESENNMKLSARLLLLPAMISLLTACGEESNTLPDPVANNEAETTTTCQDKSFCLTGQFVDEPVVGLNYSCNLVEGITDEEGTFSCPSNSVATFYLQSTVSKRKITLGKYRVRSLGKDNGNLVKILLTVTPMDLVGKTPENFPTNTTTEEASQITNILRLLQALDSDGHSTDKSTNRIVIDSKDKKFIDELSRDIALSDFTNSENIDKLLQPMFDKIPNKSMTNISAAQALSRFQDTLNFLHAGAYEVIPTGANLLDFNGTTSYTGMLGKWSNSDLHSMVAMFFIVDREGKTIGNAFEWQKSLTTSQLDNGALIREVLLSTKPTPLNFKTSDPVFSAMGKVTENFILQSSTGQIKLTQGVMSKGIIVGGERFYRNTYGLNDTEEFDKTHLGTWKRYSSDSKEQLTSSFNLQKNRTVNMYLEPTIWRTPDNVASGEKPIFPLHLRLTLRDNDKSTSCGGQSGNGCFVGDMGITILANGNIITDRDNDCTIVDSKTLIENEADPVQEQRLGFISTVLRDDVSKKPIPSITPVMLVGSWAKDLPSTDPWAKFYGIYFGMPSGLTGGTKVEIDISSVLDKVVIMKHQKDEQKTFGVVPSWTNYASFINYYSMSETERSLLDGKLQGHITNIQTQACYNPQPKI